MKKYAMPKKRPITPARFMAALKGSYGNRTTIAQRLDVARGKVDSILYKRPGRDWNKVRKAYEAECERICDVAEKTLGELMEQKKDMSERGRTSRWLLEKRRAAIYGDRKTVTVEGGANPLKVESNSTLNLGALNLSLETKKQLLEALQKVKKDKADRKVSQ